jgi:hypothetical protein
LEDVNAIVGSGFDILALQPAYHGAGIPIPIPGSYQNINVLDNHMGDELIEGFLRGQLQKPTKAIMLTGILHHIRYLTARLIAEGYDFSGSPVLAICGTGQYLGKRWKKFRTHLGR